MDQYKIYMHTHNRYVELEKSIIGHIGILKSY